MTLDGLEGLSREDVAQVILQVTKHAEAMGELGVTAEVLAEAVHEMEGLAVDAVMWHLWRHGRVVVGWGSDGLVWLAVEATDAADGKPSDDDAA